MKPLAEFHRQESAKDGVRPRCKVCRNESHRLYRKSHPKIRREQQRRYRKNNPERIRKQRRKYRENNPEIRREQFRRWRERYPEKMKEVHRRYYLDNTDKILDKIRVWRENNPEKATFINYRSGDGCCLYCFEVLPWMLNNHHPWKAVDPDFTITLCENHHAVFTRGVPALLEDWH